MFRFKENKLPRTCPGGNECQLHTSRRPRGESNITIGDNFTAYSISSKRQLHYFEKLENIDITTLGREPVWSLEAHSEEFTGTTQKHWYFSFLFVW